MLGFKWIIEKRLAGSPQPGLYGDWANDVAYLRNAGVTTVISLTEEPLIEEGLQDDGFKTVHFPIRDMDVPQPRSVFALVNKMLTEFKHEVILLHCKGGVGRTGTIAACYLAAEGLSGDEAVKAVRTVHAAFIQTPVQETFVTHFKQFFEANADYQGSSPKVGG